ncbi:phosphotransferase enzyme family protein [Ceratobasidium sp. AG-Ba]|nr:phosphotransferase enzyme family protein [Ceratobasidium sp. AG-Ba]
MAAISEPIFWDPKDDRFVNEEDNQLISLFYSRLLEIWPEEKINTRTVSIDLLDQLADLVRDVHEQNPTVTCRELIDATKKSFEFLWLFLENREAIKNVEHVLIMRYVSSRLQFLGCDILAVPGAHLQANPTNRVIEEKDAFSMQDKRYLTEMIAKIDIASLFGRVMLLPSCQGGKYFLDTSRPQYILGQIPTLVKLINESARTTPGSRFSDSQIVWAKVHRQLEYLYLNSELDNKVKSLLNAVLVYDIKNSNGTSLNAVARVASPAFPKDKMGSEVATLNYVKSQTTVPVPCVYYWESNSTNPVGAEYMILEKIQGVSASEAWPTLEMQKKHAVVSGVARYLIALFKQRFSTGGSLYISSEASHTFVVGPVISVPFFRALDGKPRVPANEWPLLRIEQESFRGPFATVTDYLLSAVRAELNFLKLYRPYAMPAHLEGLERGKQAMADGELALLKALELYPLFPGDMPVYSPMPSPEQPFSIRLDDFRLSNIMIDESTGKVTGLIDFEVATIAPTWACAALPGWLVEEDHEDRLPGEESDDIRAQLRQTFMAAISEADPTGEWERAQSAGRPYRYLLGCSNYFVVPWGYRLEYFDALLEWCKTHPGEIYAGPVDPSDQDDLC